MTVLRVREAVLLDARASAAALVPPLLYTYTKPFLGARKYSQPPRLCSPNPHTQFLAPNLLPQQRQDTSGCCAQCHTYCAFLRRRYPARSAATPCLAVNPVVGTLLTSCAYCRDLTTKESKGGLGKECEEQVFGCLWTDDTTNRVPCDHFKTVVFFGLIATLFWMIFVVRACIRAGRHVAWCSMRTPCAYLGPAHGSMGLPLCSLVHAYMSAGWSGVG